MSCLSPGFWWLPAILGVRWLVGITHNASLSIYTAFSLFVSAACLLQATPDICGFAACPNPERSKDPYLNDISKDSSKAGWVLRFQGEVYLRGPQFRGHTVMCRDINVWHGCGWQDRTLWPGGSGLLWPAEMRLRWHSLQTGKNLGILLWVTGTQEDCQQDSDVLWLLWGLVTLNRKMGQTEKKLMLWAAVIVEDPGGAPLASGSSAAEKQAKP